MLGLGINLQSRVSGGQLIGYYRLTETTNVGVLIVKKSDTAPKTILRYLDWEADKTSGTYAIYWDGLTDKGADVIAGGDWEAEIVTNKIAFDWTTALNSSAINHGSTLYHSYSGASGAVAVDSKIVLIDLYNEAASRVAFYCSQSALQAKTNILGFGTPNSRNVNSTNSVLQYVTYDANYIYFGGSNGPGSGLGNIIHAVKRSDLTEVTFTSGVIVDEITARYYASVIGDRDDTHILTGLCAANGFLYAAYAGQNKIDCMDCTSATTPSGAIVSTRSTTVDNCREIDWDSGKSRIIGLRTFSTDTEALFVMGINVSTGAMSAPAVLGLTVTATGKKTLKVNNNTHVLAILYGSTEQCIHLFDISGTTPTGSVTSKIGVVGGMQSTSTVANDRFIFTDYSGGLTFALRKPWIGVNLANDQWIIGDVGNERIVYTTDTGTYVDKTQWQPSTYAVGQNANNPYYMTAGGLVAEKVSSVWTNTKNYRQFITANYLTQEQYGVFQYIFTLNISGVDRTFATIVDVSTLSGGVNWDGVYSYQRTEIVELTSTGITYTGIFINPIHDNFNGVLQKYSSTELIIYRLTSTNWNAGTSPTLKQQIIQFSSGSPVVGSETTACTLDPIITNDCLNTTDGVGFLAGVSDDGMAIVFNNSLDARFTEHLGGYKISTGDKIFGTYFPTTQWNQDSKIGYSGEFPDLRYSQRGNGSVNNFQNAKVAGNIIFIHEKQENFRGKQTAITNFWTSTGRPLTQVGITSQEGDALEESAIRAAGNGVSFHGAFDPNDISKFILNYGDESRRSAISIEEGSMFNTISSNTAQILTPPNSETFTSNRYPILEDLTRSAIVATGGRITLSHSQTSSFKAETNILRWDQPDIYLYLNCSSEFGSYKYAEIALDNPSADLASWVLNGKINWYGYNGGESISTYPNIDPGAMLQVLDNNGLIIAEFGLGQGDVTDTFKLRCNGTQMLSYTDQYTAVTRTGENKDFTITTDIDSCTFNWDGEEVTANFLNPLANQFYPKYVRLVVRDRDTNHQGQRIIAASDLIFEQILTGGVAPQLVSANTYNSTTLELVLNEQPSVYSLNGYSFKVNGVIKTATSVTNVGNALRFAFSYTFLFGDVVTCSYDQSTGDTSRSGLELITFTNSSVTNTIPDASSAVIVQRKVVNTGADTIAFDSNVTAGNFLMVIGSGTIAAFGTSATYSNGDTVTQIRDEHVGFGTGLNMFMVYNTTGGASKTFTITGIGSNIQLMAFEIQNVKNSGNPLLAQDGAQGTGTTLSKTLNPAQRSMIIAAYANGNGSQFVSFGGGVTLDTNNSNNAVGFILNQASGSVTPVVNVTSDSNNVAIFASIELQ